MCGTPILLELNALSEQGRKWAARFHRLLVDTYHDSNYGRGKIPKRKRCVSIRPILSMNLFAFLRANLRFIGECIPEKLTF